MRLLPLTSCLLFLTSASAQVAQLRWDVQVDRPVPHDFPVWQGETVDLMPRLVQGTAPVAVTNSPVEFRYREAALAANVYRYVTAEPNTNTGVLAVRWIPDYDAGAAFYDYQIIVGSNAANPRAFGRITMRPTIGWQASTSPPPAILHYATAAQVQAASNALAEAVQAESQTRAATNVLFAAWFAGLFSATSNWSTAYGWGDWHSAVALKLDIAATNGWEVGSHANFLTSAPPQSVASVNGMTGAVSVTAASIGALTDEQDLAALAALADFATTNRATRLWGVGGETYALADGTIYQMQIVTNFARAFTNAAMSILTVETAPGSLSFINFAGPNAELYYSSFLNKWSLTYRVIPGETAYYRQSAATNAASLTLIWDWYSDGEYGEEITLGETWVPVGQPTNKWVQVSSWATTQMVAAKVDASGGTASNLWLQGNTIVSDSYTNLLWRNVYSNGWHWLVAYTNTPGGAE